MLSRLRHWFSDAKRRPAQLAAAALVLAATGYLLLLGWEAWEFRQAKGAAQDALAHYEFPEARRQLARCLQLRPDDAPCHLLAAQAARRAGDLDAAQQHLDRYRDLLPEATPAGTLELALLQAQRGQVHDVMDLLLSDLEIHHPGREQILEALALGCVQIYHLDRAGFWLRELLTQFPNNPIGLLTQAEMAETKGQHQRSEEMLRLIIAKYPNHATARFRLAQTLFQAHKFAEANEQYAWLHEHDPGAIPYLLGLVHCSKQLDRPEELRRFMRLVQERSAASSDALLECARFAIEEMRFADAVALLRKAVVLAPRNHEVNYNLGLCLQQLNQKEEAQRHLDIAQEIQQDLTRLEKVFEAVIKTPDDAAPRVEAGRICLRNGQFQEAARWLQGALQLAPQSAEAHAALAELKAAQTNADQSGITGAPGGITPRLMNPMD